MNYKINKKAIQWLTTAHFMNDIYSGFLNPIMPFIADKIGFSMFVATIIISVAQICASVIQPLFGFLADNHYKRIFIFFGLILGSIGAPFATNVPNIWLFTIFIILGNVGGSLFHPQALGLLSKFSKGNFMFNMSSFVAAGTIGFAIGPITSSLVAQYLGFKSLPYLAIFGVITALLMFKYVPKLSIIQHRLEHNYFKETFIEILSNKFLLILTIIALFKSLIISGCTILLPFLWKDIGHSPLYIGTALFFFLLAGSISSFVSSWFEKRFGTKFILYCSMTLTLPLMLIFVLTYKTYPNLAYLIFILMGFVNMFAQSVILVMAQKIMPKYKGVVSGFINGFVWGVAAVILTIVSYFAQQFGVAEVMLITAILPAICSYLVRYLPEYTEDNN